MSVTRRQFLSAGLAAGAALMATDAWAESGEVLLTRHDLPLPGLPAGLDGLRVAQVTDVHLPFNQGWARAALRLLAAERPEVVLATGDVLDHHAGERSLRAPFVGEFLDAMRGTLGTVALIGNHERALGLGPAALDHWYRRHGITFALNRAVRLDTGSGVLAIVALDDPVSGAPDVRAALREVDTGHDAQLLALHAPGPMDTIALPEGHRLGAALAGHTHGGQVRLPLLPAVLPRDSGRFVAGWYRDAVIPTYVSRGIGASGVRVRTFCPAELAVFTLRRS